MAKRAKPLPRVARRECAHGIVHTFDSGGRLCLDIESRERIVLVHDLRTYGAGLHIGALGWTIPETTDGYTFADVWFDTGQKLRLKRYAFARAAPEAANSVAERLIARNRNTRFDADVTVAASCREDWIAKSYGGYLTLSETVVNGVGDQELYAFSFPSLIELARLKGQDRYPVKIGFSRDASAGALGRIRSQIIERAGFPEKPSVLLVFKTWDGRSLETQVHNRLRLLGRRTADSLGREWFLTSTVELLQTIDDCCLADLPSDRLIAGAEETLEDGTASLLATGARLEFGMVPGQAGISIRIRHPDEAGGSTDAREPK